MNSTRKAALKILRSMVAKTPTHITFSYTLMIKFIVEKKITFLKLKVKLALQKADGTVHSFAYPKLTKKTNICTVIGLQLIFCISIYSTFSKSNAAFHVWCVVIWGRGCRLPLLWLPKCCYLREWLPNSTPLTPYNMLYLEASVAIILFFDSLYVVTEGAVTNFNSFDSQHVLIWGSGCQLHSFDSLYVVIWGTGCQLPLLWLPLCCNLREWLLTSTP